MAEIFSEKTRQISGTSSSTHVKNFIKISIFIDYTFENEKRLSHMFEMAFLSFSRSYSLRPFLSKIKLRRILQMYFSYHGSIVLEELPRLVRLKRNACSCKGNAGKNGFVPAFFIILTISDLKSIKSYTNKKVLQYL